MPAETKPRTDYANRPCYPELVAVVIAGALHVATEITLSAWVARMYNVMACSCFGVYLVWRASRSEGVFRAWGMRLDNLPTALAAQLGFGALGALALFGYGLAAGSAPLPKTFWLTLGLYPVWGTAQQFGLQNLVAKNLTGLLPNRLALALVCALLFGAAHCPRGPLMLLAFSAGLFFTLIYRRFPNLWAVGIAHGILGALAFYIVLGEDPGATVLQFFTG